jgi:hypothetical protein
MIDLNISPVHVEFISSGQLVGRYCYRDSHKPFLHPLNTPRGVCVTLASPHDHRHHKGLMYSLVTNRANYWEEVAKLKGERIGRQEHVSFDSFETGRCASLSQRLRWVEVESGDEDLTEQRTISCHAESSGYVWTWQSRLTASRDLRLRFSAWAMENPARRDGRKINYHGLGVRLRREFGGDTGGCELLLDRERFADNEFSHALGFTPVEATYVGSVDGGCPPQRASVSIAPAAGHALFVLNKPFAWMSFGPTNLEERDLMQGDVLEDTYSIKVADA